MGCDHVLIALSGVLIDRAISFLVRLSHFRWQGTCQDCGVARHVGENFDRRISGKVVRCDWLASRWVETAKHITHFSSRTKTLAPRVTGWLIGPQELTTATLAASTRIIFCTNTPLQEAVAAGLELAPQYKFFEDQRQAYTERRDLLCSYFDKLGLGYTMPEGSYFVLVDVSKVRGPQGLSIPRCRVR